MEMLNGTLLAYVGLRHAHVGENLATDAFAYLLRAYPVAAAAFLSHLEPVGLEVGRELRFDIQYHSASSGIPDLVGCDESGRRVLVIESKFWAELTRNQPLSYLDVLDAGPNGIVLFLAPKSRLKTLWTELLVRCDSAGRPTTLNEHSSGPRWASIEGARLALTAWEPVLQAMREALAAAGDVAGEHEVRQLEGLCARLDTDGFHPLEQQELVFSSDKEEERFKQLARDVTDRLVEQGLANTKAYRRTGGIGSYKCYMTLAERKNWCIQFNRGYWEEHGHSPLWLTKYDSAPATLQALERSPGPDAVEFVRDDRYLLIPLRLPIGVERHDVVADLARQVAEIVSALDGRAVP